MQCDELTVARVVYSTGLVISDAAELSTLCVFYDRVLLPSTSANSCNSMIVLIEPEAEQGYKIFLTNVTDAEVNDPTTKSLVSPGTIVQGWFDKHRILFQEEVLKRMKPNNANLTNEKLDETLQMLKSVDAGSIDQAHLYHSDPLLFMWQDHLLHLLRTDFDAPRLFSLPIVSHHRENIKQLMATSTFRFLLPRLSDLTDEQILEVRRKVKDTREGFSMHLQSLSADVDKMLKGGENPKQIAKFAAGVVETKLIPDFSEFRRQLIAEKAGFWRGVLDKASKVLEIDSSVWTPKFYGDFLKAMGFSLLEHIEESKDEASNKTQAMQYMLSVKEYHA